MTMVRSVASAPATAAISNPVPGKTPGAFARVLAVLGGTGAGKIPLARVLRTAFLMRRKTECGRSVSLFRRGAIGVGLLFLWLPLWADGPDWVAKPWGSPMNGGYPLFADHCGTLHQVFGDDAEAWFACVDAAWESHCTDPGTRTTGIGITYPNLPDSPGWKAENYSGCSPVGGIQTGVLAYTYNSACNEASELDDETYVCLGDLGEVPNKHLDGEPQSGQPCPPNGSNPCNPADGNKFEKEVDYSSTAAGGLSFSRYYNSLGAYNTGDQMGIGWRHTYSRALDEEPDKQPIRRFSAPAYESSSYVSDSDACTDGWDEIKSSVWSGDLASATATFSGGNVCTISSGGSTVAYFQVRATYGWANYQAPTTIRTITRPDGRNYKFEQSGSDWVNELDASVKLEASGSNWIFTDSNDTQETYNSSGQLVSIEYRNGQTETLDYDLTTAQGGDDDDDTLDKVTGPFGHVITFAYDTNGHLESITTPDGDVQYGYDSNNNLTSVTYPDETVRQYLYEHSEHENHLTGIVDENEDQYATWDYDDAGRAILSMHGTNKEIVEFTYNGNGTTTLDLGDTGSGPVATRTYDFEVEQGTRKLSSLTGDVCGTCPGGQYKAKTYDSNGFLDEATDWNNVVTKTERNSRGLTETLTEADSTADERVTYTTWHSTYRLPTEISTSKNDTEYTYDTDGNPTQITITDGTNSRTWTMTYNSSGQVLTVNGPRTDVTDTTTFTYNTCTTGAECGQLATMTNALSQVTYFDSYDDSGRLTQMTDPNGLETAFTYDDRGNVLTIVQTPTVGTARTTTMTYDDAGQLATLTLPDSHSLTYTYDDAHYLTQVEDNFGNYIEYDYDVMGNRTGEDVFDPTDTLSRALDFVYDANNRLETITEPGSYDTDYTFDDVGNLVDITNPATSSWDHDYDYLNRLEQITDPLSGYTNFTYDVHDNLTQVSAPNGADTDYTYDDLDNLTEEDSPDRGTITYTHDAAGNVLSMTDARNKVTEYTYDALNRLTEIELDNDDTITFQYDTGTNAKGHLNKITDPSGETTWTYNNFGQVTSKSQKIGTITLTTDYEYDTAGRLDTMTLPSGKEVTYGYDDNLPDSVTVDTTTILDSATYDPFGPVNGWTWGNSTTHSRTYNTRGLLTSQKMVTDTRTLTYDSVGDLATLDDSRHDLEFDYNVLSQITDFTAAGSAPLTSQDYTYDENGNRETLVQNSTTYNFSITANTNRLASTTGPTAKSYTYDATGNVTSDGIYDYAYDDRGRLVDIDSGSVTYEHNGQGQRVKKDDGSNVTLFVYDEAGQLIGEYDGSGNLIQEHVWFNGMPVAVLTSSDEYYVHTDHLGTPRIVSDSNTTIWRWESGPFGEEVAQEDPDGDQTDFTYNLRFPGQYYDVETGLHYNYFRTYDPSTGRYLESDPIGLIAGLNTYGYVSANPLGYVDPYGLYEGGGIAEARRRQAEQAAAQAQVRAREAAARQRQAQKDFERFQELCTFAGYKNCDQPFEGYNDAMSHVGDACEILGAASGLYSATNVPVLKLVPKVHIYGKTPGGRPYTAHYSLDRANRRIPPSVVDNTIDTTKGTPGRNGTTVHYDPVNNVTVVTGDGQSIVTVHRGKP